MNGVLLWMFVDQLNKDGISFCKHVFIEYVKLEEFGETERREKLELSTT